MKNISNFAFAVKKINDYYFLRECGVKRIVLGSKNLSKWGELEHQEIKDIIIDSRKNQIEIQIECDVLPTENQLGFFQNCWKDLNLNSDECTIRVCDVGLMDWFYSRGYRLIPILEAGFHNLRALSLIEEQYGDKISYFVLSKEIPFEVQKKYSEFALNKDIEFNFVSPLQLLYTPRKLLESFSLKLSSSYRQTFASSEESVHKGFIVRENHWGTILFHPKHFSVLSRWESINEYKNCHLLVDLRLVENDLNRLKFYQLIVNFANGINDKKQMEEVFLNDFPFPLFRGFFDTNKTDILFSKLKNSHSEHPQYQRVGIVLDMIKGKKLIIKIVEGQKLKLGDSIVIQSPLNRQISLDLTRIVDLAGREIAEANQNSVVSINYVKNFPTQSVIFKVSENVGV